MVVISGVKKQANRLKKVRGLDKERFIYGIHSSKLIICPGCNKKLCYWIGGSPHDIECLNDGCRFYKKPPTNGRYKFASDRPYEEDWQDKKESEKDTKKIETDDLDFGTWG